MYMTPNELKKGENSIKGFFFLTLPLDKIFTNELRDPTTMSPCLC